MKQKQIIIKTNHNTIIPKGQWNKETSLIDQNLSVFLLYEPT